MTAFGALALHSGTAYWDQVYAEPRRRVAPAEQHVHSLLEVCPLMAALFVTALHWDQARALAGRDRRGPRFGIRFKRHDPLPRPAARLTSDTPRARWIWSAGISRSKRYLHVIRARTHFSRTKPPGRQPRR